METTSSEKPARRSFIRRCFSGLLDWTFARRGLMALAAIATLIAVFYVVEDWRGKRAWEECKRVLARQGTTLDWAAFMPKPVPDDQNAYKAPQIAEWFVRRAPGSLANDLNTRLGLAGLDRYVRYQSTNLVAVVTIVPAKAEIPPGDADVVLSFEGWSLSISGEAPVADAKTPMLPLIVMNDVPLYSAITNLASQAGIAFTFDPKTHKIIPVTGATVKDVRVSLRWENLSARQAFLALLNNYGLLLVENTKSGVALITVKKQGEEDVYPEVDATERLAALTRRAVNLDTNAAGLMGTRNFRLIVRPSIPGPPARVFVRADKIPTPKEIANFFPTNALTPGDAFFCRYNVEPFGADSFRVSLSSSPAYTAADFLAWSDAFTNDFNVIRDALQRPYAEISGQYLEPNKLQIPNFITHRAVAQTLADRAKCYLLLGRPEAALRELTLMRDQLRLLESKPVTLVAAMIKVAIGGLYADTIADGLRLRAWGEPELAALEQQLTGLNLMTLVRGAFETEPAASCRSIETTSAEDWQKWFGGDSTNLWGKLRSPTYLFFAFGPRGWRYQNMAAVARLEGRLAGCVDLTNNRVTPLDLAAAHREIERVVSDRSPYHMLAAMVVPNFSRAVQVTARNQTSANQASIVCALERFRMARGAYPESLDALIPQFAEKIPHDLIGGQPLRYRRTDDGQFALYSVGWNEKDDGGVPVKNPPDTEGDWVWKNR